MPRKLTDVAVRTIKPPASGRLDLIDEERPGLSLRVTPAGIKTWSFRYRVRGVGRQRATLGTYPAVALSAARKRALAIAEAASRGIDLPEHEAKQRRRDGTTGRTVETVIREYVEQRCKPNQRRWKQTERMLEQHVLPKLGGRAIASLRRGDIAEFLSDLLDTTSGRTKRKLSTQVNRVHAQLRAAFNYAVEREYIDANPAAVVKKQFRGETPRDRVLSDDELRAVWSAADALSEPSRSLVMAWILTGQRVDEVRCMPWSELDLDAGVWTLPPERTKAKRRHEVPLPPAMVDLLRACDHVGPFVFSVDGPKPYAGQKRLKANLDKASKVPGWTLHDLRRTCASGLAALGVAQDVIARVLNHSDRSVTAVYNRHAYLEEKRAALTAWAGHVAALAAGAQGSEKRSAPSAEAAP